MADDTFLLATLLSLLSIANIDIHRFYDCIETADDPYLQWIL
jgi:hypothetical protein